MIPHLTGWGRSVRWVAAVAIVALMLAAGILVALVPGWATAGQAVWVNPLFNVSLFVAVIVLALTMKEGLRLPGGMLTAVGLLVGTLLIIQFEPSRVSCRRFVGGVVG